MAEALHRVVAVLLNWRQAASTVLVLEDLAAAQTALRPHVVVIDNGSADGSDATLREAVARLEVRSGLSAEFVPLRDNVGYCAAINRGLAHARGLHATYVLLLNNDIRLPVGYLDPLVDLLDHDERVGAVGPTIVDPGGRTWSQGGRVAMRPNLLVLNNHGGEPAPTDAGPEAVDFLPGACVLLRMSALDEVGKGRAKGVDESYFMYWEDVDLGTRLRLAGWSVVWVPWVRIEHAAGGSSGGGRSPLRKYMMAVNSVRYLRRHGGIRLWSAFVVLECLLWPLSFTSGARAALAKGRGLIAGVRGRPVTVADVARYTKRRTS